MSKQIARWIALGALFLIPLTPLLVANSFFFPFITGKAFFFRICVEVAVAAWVVLALLDKAYRPRFSWIGVAVISFVVWMFVADLFAVNVEKAFWSNFERMEGWILLIHLLGLFFAASAVLRVEKKWRAWFLASLGVSVVVIFHSFFQLLGWSAIHQGSSRIDASFGNSAYLAIYFLFNTFIAGWLALTEERLWLKWSLAVLACVEAILIFSTETRGTVLGLVGALLLVAFLTALTANARARRSAVGAICILVVLVGGFYLARNSTLVQGNHSLQRIASISLADGQTRFTIWHMAWEGFKERPVVGWGQEGFNYVFNKYYDPSLYNQEPWFDRAHNAFLDWLMAGGLPAFLLYLSLFGSALVLLWRTSTLSRAERLALTGALVGYAVHNLFVFDNLYSYVYFFAILALIDSQVARPLTQSERLPEVDATNVTPIAAVVAVALILIYFVNVPGMKASTELITAISPSSTGIQGNLATFQDLLMHPSFAAQEIREQLVSFAGSVQGQSSVPTTLQQQIAAFAVSEMQKQNTEHPGDAREVLELSIAYRTANDLQHSLEQLSAAENLSANKEQILTQKGIAELTSGDVVSARADFNKAYALGPEFPDLATYVAAGDFAAGVPESAHTVLQQAFGTTTVDSDILAYVYYNTKDYPDFIALWQLRARQPGAAIDTWFGLAGAYYIAGNQTAALRTLDEALVAHPEAATEIATAKSQITSGSLK